ncbi:hypothetical protein B0T14DRAFT_514442 [Immersiella caudata]|uniref:HPt domain-containing protein n=1 Tax=Immersiella caudata TaxID=314043 RepID=A0AA39WW73_9PEZI|nr:hypothetical protein B0T14DRAFT_514442 [Immersiella caudata]
MPDFGDHVDMHKFQAVLDMDGEGEDREFSRTVVEEYFRQFEVAIDEIDAAIGSQDLHSLASLGSTLGGSSRSLGFTKIADGCSLVEENGIVSGRKVNADGGDTGVRLGKIQQAVLQMKPDFEEAKRLVLDFYKNG